jgi:hypothetical protein
VQIDLRMQGISHNKGAAGQTGSERFRRRGDFCFRVTTILIDL